MNSESKLIDELLDAVNDLVDTKIADSKASSDDSVGYYSQIDFAKARIKQVLLRLLRKQ